MSSDYMKEKEMKQDVLDDDAVPVTVQQEDSESKKTPNQVTRTTYSDTFSTKWTKTIEKIRQPLNRLLLDLTRRAATHPKKYIVSIISFSILVLVVGLLTNFQTEAEDDAVWTPKNSRPLTHRDWLDDSSGFPEDPRNFFLLVHTNGGNVLGHAGVDRVFTALDTVRETDGYSNLCSNADDDGQSACSITAVTTFWNQTRAVFEKDVNDDDDEAAIAAISADYYPDGTKVDVDWILGNSQEDENGILTFAQLYIVRIDLPDVGSEAEDFETVALDNALDLKDAWEAEADNAFRLEVVAERSFEDEFARAIMSDLPLIPIVFIIMAVFTCIIFSKCDRVEARSLLGFGAVCCVLLSIMTGYGLMFIIGIPLTSMTQILPFVMFGIGLDDAFIIAGAFDRTDPRKDCVERIRQTFEDVGVSVTLTSITSATAFGLGCISSIPAVYWLCLYAFPTILIDFIYQVTFFVALIAIDERRVRENRRDCCFWHTAAISLDEAAPQVDTPPVEAAHVEAALPVVEATTDDETRIWIEPKGHVADRFMVWYGKFLMQPWVKCLVLVGFAGLFSGLAYSASLLTQEFEVTDMVPDDSYLTEFFDTFDDYSARGSVVPEVVFRFVDQSDPVIQDQMEEYVSDLVALDEVVDPPPSFWLEDFKIFTNTSMTSDLPFTQQIDLFLADPVYHKHNDDISRDVDGDIIASRCEIFMDNVDFNDVKQQIDALENQRAVTASQDINQDKKDWPFFTFAEIYMIWEFYATAVDELLLTTILGVAAVTGIAFLLIPHWTAAPFVAVSLIVLYVELLGVLQVAGLYINVVTYIAMVMSIGLLVDFVCHMLLRYYETPGNTRDEKTKETLRTMGSSILLGSLSTFLGVLPLAFSTSEIFTTIFKAFIGLVTLGAAQGLILLPVVLSLVGPLECTRTPKSTTTTRENSKEESHASESIAI